MKVRSIEILWRGGGDAELFYKLHDKETLDKLCYTGTTIFRNKVVADIGCGCGAFLDYIKGVAKEVIAVEPSKSYQNVMRKKGFHIYGYSDEAKEHWKNKVDVITTFDVIEHVEDPIKFITDIFDLLSEEGQAIIGTPTEAPVMRELLGEIFEKKLLFSTQHMWIFSEKNLKLIAENVGFKKVKVKYYQRYGLDNLFGWLIEKEPCSNIRNSIITETFDNVWKNECNRIGLSDYIVLYLCK